MLNLIFCLFISPSYGKEVWVRPYTRSDGTSVSGHYRTISGSTSTVGVIPYADLNPQQTSNKGNFSLNRGFANGSPYVQLKWKSGYYRFRSTCTNEGEQHTVSYQKGDLSWSDYYLLENKLWVGNEIKEKFSINVVHTATISYGHPTEYGMKSFSTYIITELVDLKSGKTEKQEREITSSEYKDNRLIGDYLSSCRAIKKS